MEYLIILRLIHIVCAVLWGGGVIYLALFIVPAVKALGPDGGKFMQQLSQTNKMPVIMTLAGTLTVVGGILLIERLSGGFTAAWFGTPHGIVISTGATFALIAYLIGMFVNRPSVARMAEIGKAAAEKGGPPSPGANAGDTEIENEIIYGNKLDGYTCFSGDSCDEYCAVFLVCGIYLHLNLH